MDKLTRLKLGVRAAAGHDAYRIVRENGVDDGAEILAEAFVTYMLAHAAVCGWDATLERVYAAGRVQRAFSNAPVGKLELVVNKQVDGLRRRPA